jgi:hypothetical protein
VEKEHGGMLLTWFVIRRQEELPVDLHAVRGCEYELFGCDQPIFGER